MSVRPRDDGLLGADPVTWRVVMHPGSLVGGMRALIVQAFHPLAMAGVAQHSDYARRPLDRLRRTTYYVVATAFGDTETALGAAEQVRRRHSLVKGTDPVTGRPYSAGDPDTQIWVHVAEWHSLLAGARAFGMRLSAEEVDRYYAEGAIIGSLLGTPRERVPASAAEVRTYFAAVRPQLCVSAEARTAIDFVVDPPLTRQLLPLQVPLRIYGNAAMALVPRALRRIAGMDRPAPLDVAALAAAAPLLGVTALPGARRLVSLVTGGETRGLIEARMRARPDAAGTGEGAVARAA